MTQAKRKVTTGMSGIVIIEPKQLTSANISVLSGVTEVQASKPLCTLVRNSTKDEQLLPKNMIIGTASKSPLQLPDIEKWMGRNTVNVYA